MASGKKSGAQIAKESVVKFEAWIDERRRAEDWTDYIRGSQLNRTEIAKECTFDTPAFRQNPTIEKLLGDLEEELSEAGVFRADKRTATMKATTQRASKKLGMETARIGQLEQKNSMLKAEIEDLKNSLKKYELFDRHLEDTGRMIKP